MIFSVHYFDLPLRKACKNNYRDVNQDEFWVNAEKMIPGIKYGIGLYVFGRKYGNNYTPFYVGKTLNSFCAEIFNEHKLRKYEKCIREEKGSLCIILIVARTPTGRIKVFKDKSLIDQLESLFIGYAYQRNNKLYNVSKLGFYKNISVPDILNSEKGVSNKSSQRLKNMLLGIPLKKSSKKQFKQHGHK